jgi:hypothetical protein
MDPNVSRELEDVYGSEFEKKYKEYEKNGKYVRKVKARDL